MLKLLCAFLIAAPLGAQQVRIATFSGSLPDTQSASYIGSIGTWSNFLNAYGQVFTAPENSIALRLVDYWFHTIPGFFDGAGPAQLSIFPFLEGMPSGAPLFTSSFLYPTSTSVTPVAFSMTTPIVAGRQYIALVSATADIRDFAAVPVFTNSPSNTAGGLLYSCQLDWNPAIPGAPRIVGPCNPENRGGVVAPFDAVFDVTTVPEPSTLLFTGAGLVAACLLYRRQVATRGGHRFNPDL